MLNNEIEKKKQSKKKRASNMKWEKKLRVEIEKENKFKNYRK
jgi:hypothetical protein